MRLPAFRHALILALSALAAASPAQGAFHLDDRLSAATPALPYGAKVGGELGASWLLWGADPLPLLPPAGMILGSPWHFGFVRAALDANSSGGTSHAGATAHLEPIGILQLKANLSRDWQVVAPSGDFPAGVDALGQVDRRGVEGQLIPIPWPYGYAGYDGDWERLTPSGSQAGGFVDTGSGLIGSAGGDVLVTHLFFLVWIPRPSINVTAFAVLQGMQGSGEQDNIQGLKLELPRGSAVYSLTLGRWEGPHGALPAFGQLGFTWVGSRALDR